MMSCVHRGDVSTCPSAAKVGQHVEEEDTPATTVPDPNDESDYESFGCQTDREDEEMSQAAVPQQLTAGPPPPREDEVPRQLQPGPPPPMTIPRQLQPGPPPPPSCTIPRGPCDQAEAVRAAPQECCQEGSFTFGETFFVFDYDDTILPSTWIQRQGLRLDSASQPTPEQMAALGELAAIASRTLQLARQHGTVIFITNAERGWIELSCQKFLPTLAPMLENIKMISARTTYEGPLAPSPLDWKLRAFEDQIAHHFGSKLSDVSARKNILSLGDGIHEREAVLTTTMSLPNCVSKSLKFVERPDISQVVKQHELISSAFDKIVHQTSNLDLRIRCP